ncbi:MAG: hypothetical protein IPK68_14735 [Bdellovibrionales bacterium]|nr:hypothetical protein [Bdellovibrionales bacterium]
MVLDLSGNGGGSLDDAVRIAGLFFRVGNVVKQSSRDIESQEPLILPDRDTDVDWAGPLVVLISRVSASASGNCIWSFERLQESRRGWW